MRTFLYHLPCNYLIIKQHFISTWNTHIQNAQFHVAVSCKGTEYTHQQLLDIAHRYLKEMGYAEEGQPLLVYAHHDTDNNHIHIVTSRVAPDGHKIDHNHEKRRSHQVTQKIMDEYTVRSRNRKSTTSQMTHSLIAILPKLSSVPSWKA